MTLPRKGAEIIRNTAVTDILAIENLSIRFTYLKVMTIKKLTTQVKGNRNLSFNGQKYDIILKFIITPACIDTRSRKALSI